MPSILTPCPSCHRHVRTNDASCPFCGVSIESAVASVAARRSSGLVGRAAVLALSATLGVGCGGAQANTAEPGAQNGQEQSSQGEQNTPSTDPSASPSPEASTTPITPETAPVALYGAVPMGNPNN